VEAFESRIRAPKSKGKLYQAYIVEADLLPADIFHVLAILPLLHCIPSSHNGHKRNEPIHAFEMKES
jgi:hypothetical protein